MSLPGFSTQGSLFSTAALGASLFADDDRYRLFAKLIYPCLVRVRPQLEKAYSPDTGRTAIEPVLLLGVCLLQYVDGIPDRQAVDWLRYHAGWNFALNRQLGDERSHPTTLSRFRERLEEHGLAALGFQAVLDGLVEAGLVRRNARQRLDSTQVFGLVSKMSRVEGLRQTIRLALEELAEVVDVPARPEQWGVWWTLYVESQIDYRASREVLGSKMAEAGADAGRILAWLKEHPQRADGEQIRLLARVFEEQFILEAGEFRPRGKGELESGRVQNPLDPEWNQTTCTSCEMRERCLGKGIRHKSIVVGEHHSALQTRRLEQKTEPFRQRMHHRAAIEGTQSELVRAHGLRRARYRGRAKVQLQAWLTGAACNLKRWLRRAAWASGHAHGAKAGATPAMG